MEWFARFAWLGRLARDVLVETSDGRFERVTEGAARPSGATELHGIMLPGLANSHSHIFHRALRGRTEGGDFWAWRQEMYRLAKTLDPDAYFRLARATFAEMVLAGVTVVGEFHYLHHPPSGQSRYSDPNEMGYALIRAAAEAGVRLTLLDSCYLRDDFDRPLLEAQRRFSDGDAEAWAERVALIEESETVRVGAAIHSVRAVDPGSIGTIAAFGGGRPLHVHVSEQASENERCLSFTGLTPTRLLAEAGVWEAGGTAVHATHLEEDDIRLLGSAGAHVCLCPTTERDLGDGIGPARGLRDAGARLCVGSDSQAVIDLLEEARLIELHQRLITGKRNLHGPQELLGAVTSTGALGWEGGEIAPDHPADFITVRLDTPRTAGPEDHILGRLVFAATAADVDTVVVGGREIVQAGQHVLVEDPAGELGRALEALG